MDKCVASGLAAVLECGLTAGCALREGTRPVIASTDGGHKSYIVPVVEIVAMDAAINLGGRMLMDPATFEITPASIRRNLRGPWVVDDDPFQINQFGHPYQGADVSQHCSRYSTAWPPINGASTKRACWSTPRAADVRRRPRRSTLSDTRVKPITRSGASAHASSSLTHCARRSLSAPFRLAARSRQGVPADRSPLRIGLA